MPEFNLTKNESDVELISIVLLTTVLLMSGYHYPDEIIKCEKSEAERLIRLNAAVPCAEIHSDDICNQSVDVESHGLSETNDVMEDFIIAAEQAIEAGKVNADGSPDIKTMENILNCHVSAEQRDAAFAAVKELQDK